MAHISCLTWQAPVQGEVFQQGGSCAICMHPESKYACRLQVLCFPNAGSAEDMYTSEGSGPRRVSSPLLVSQPPPHDRSGTISGTKFRRAPTLFLPSCGSLDSTAMQHRHPWISQKPSYQPLASLNATCGSGAAAMQQCAWRYDHTGTKMPMREQAITTCQHMAATLESTTAENNVR